MFSDKNERKILGTFYIYGCVSSGFALAWIYWIVYFLDQGFNFADVGLALAVNGLALFAFQVPAGALADTIGRKAVSVAGYAAYAIILFIMPQAATISNLIVLFGLLAVPMAMTTGIVESWIVDELKRHGEQRLISEYFTKAEAIANAGLVAASALAAAVAAFFNMDLIWYLHGAAMLASAAILSMQREYYAPKNRKIIENAGKIAANMYSGAKFSVSTTPVAKIILAAFFTFAAVEIAAISWNPFLENLGMKREVFGILSAIGAAVCVFVPFYARRFSRLKSAGEYLAGHSFIFAAVLAASILMKSPIAGAALFLLWSMRYASLVPVLDPKFQELVPAKIRATVCSVRHMAAALAMLAGDFLCLLFADSLGPGNMLAFAGIIMLPAAFLYAGIEKRTFEKETGFVPAGFGRVVSIIDEIMGGVNRQSSRDLVYTPAIKVPRSCGKRNSDDRRFDPGMYLVPRIYPPLPCGPMSG